MVKKYDNHYYMNKYTINDDLSVDVGERISIRFKNLTEIPIQFNKINGYFDCSFNNLTSLKGCPKIVDGNFYCFNNQLTSLKGIKYIGGDLYCDQHLYDSILYKSLQLMQQLQK